MPSAPSILLVWVVRVRSTKPRPAVQRAKSREQPREKRFASLKFLMENFPKLLADLVNLGRLQLGIKQIEHVVPPFHPHLPDFPVMIDSRRFIDHQPLSHQDQSQHEPKRKLGRLSYSPQPLEKFTQNRVIDENFFLLLRTRHQRLPERHDVLAIILCPAIQAAIGPLEPG